jgi:hypothetical protein
MKEYKDIIVLENDIEHIGLNRFLGMVLKNETVNVDMFWDFSSTFHYEREKSFERLKAINSDTLVLTNPSFVGSDNSFSGYLGLFLLLKQMNIKLDVAIIYYDGFFKYLIDFMYGESNYLKNQNNHRMLQEVLEFHTIYEIDFNNVNLNNGTIKNSSKLITWDNLNSYYFETHRKLPKTMMRVKATGEVYHLIYINKHVNNLEDMEFELLISETPFKSEKYTLNQIEKI